MTFYTPKVSAAALIKRRACSKNHGAISKPTSRKMKHIRIGAMTAAAVIAMCFIKNEKKDEAKKWIDAALEVKPDSDHHQDHYA